ncbi:Alkanal monooxygenase alpha chain [Nocardioides dokdonensis FR1436]|uniref:Alkanal monooxygenase alpha chain n=1 Tax=Nocardioides dokdonensis FR1436 TaxID=1300347 RepID=A0A1A9GNB9_9ACTN|nr:LLM class flavin-dependent oxidoreductase [Nocardioides dokdonensis]ANH38981.1 Alkanal monooxygenase alpha chain [Nocardioides dokdonensis FR1436]
MSTTFSPPADVHAQSNQDELDALRIGLWYDFRNPPSAQRSFSTFYREVLDQVVEAEEAGLESVWLTEHHFCPDGYTPSPLVLLAAIAERTSTMHLGTNLIVSPLHEPIRLAEDAATLSLLSGGRFDLGVGLGYWKREFEAFGRNLKNRPSLLEEGIEVIKRAWAGSAEPFEGKRHTYPGLPVHPLPEKVPGLLIGAMADKAIDRAARLGDGFLSTQNHHQEAFLDAWARHGRDLDDARIMAGQWAVVAEDPEKVWAEIGECAVYQLNAYIEWGAFGDPDEIPRFQTPADVLAGGAYRLQDAEMAIQEILELKKLRPQVRDMHYFAQLPGESVASGTARMHYLASEVAAPVKARLAEVARGPR